MDLSGLSDADLKAIANNDLGSVSTEGLKMVAGGGPSPVPAPAPTENPDNQILDTVLPHVGTVLRHMFLPPGFTVNSAGLPAPSPALNVPAAEAAKGTVEGFKRENVAPANAFEAGGQMLGRGALPAAGAAVAGALTGGAGLIPALAATGLGAGAGEAYGQLGSRAVGGNAPKTSAEAALDIGKTGLEAAATELGVRGAITVGSKLFKTLAEGFADMPVESIKRGMKKPSIVPLGGEGARASVEKQGVEALTSVQNSLENARQMAGKAVDNALKGLEKTAEKTGSKIDIAPIIQDAESVLKDASLGNKSVNAAASGDIETVRNIIESARGAPEGSPRIINVRTSTDPLYGSGAPESTSADLLYGSGTPSPQPTVPLSGKVPVSSAPSNTLAGSGGQSPFVHEISIKDAVNLRRALDNLTSFKNGGLPEVSSEVGQRAIKNMASGLRDAISNFAKKSGNTQLLTANERFSSVANAYDELRPSFSTKSEAEEVLLKKFIQLTGKFNQSGYMTEILNKAGKSIPVVNQQIQKLLDLSAARAFTMPAIKSQSGTLFRLFRNFALTPKVAAAVIRGGSAAKPLAGAVTPAVVGATPTVQDLYGKSNY